MAPNCTRTGSAVYEWNGSHNSEKLGGAVGADGCLRKAEREGGARLARKFVPGEWALIRAPDGDQYPDFYLGKGVCRNEWGGGCALEYTGSTQSQLAPQKVQFDNGDFQVALQVQIPQRDTQPSSPLAVPSSNLTGPAAPAPAQHQQLFSLSPIINALLPRSSIRP